MLRKLYLSRLSPSTPTGSFSTTAQGFPTGRMFWGQGQQPQFVQPTLKSHLVSSLTNTASWNCLESPSLMHRRPNSVFLLRGLSDSENMVQSSMSGVSLSSLPEPELAKLTSKLQGPYCFCHLSAGVIGLALTILDFLCGS